MMRVSPHENTDHGSKNIVQLFPGDIASAWKGGMCSKCRLMYTSLSKLACTMKVTLN